MKRFGVVLSTVVAVVVAFVIFTSSALAQVAPASTDIADPEVPFGWVNLFAGKTPGTPIVAGLDLGHGCKVADVDKTGGYINVGAHGPYVVGDGGAAMTVRVECDQYVSGIFEDGDDDPHGSERGHVVWFNDKFFWTPAINSADKWQGHVFDHVRWFVFEFGGDSAFFTILINDLDTGTGTPTPGATATPPQGDDDGDSTPTPTGSATATPDMDLDTGTPTPTATPPQGDDDGDGTPTVTATATATPDLDLDEGTPTPTPTKIPTSLDPAPEPNKLPAFPRVWLPTLSS